MGDKIDIILPDAAKVSWWAAMIDGISPLVTMEVGLFKSALSVNRYLTLEECLDNEADYPGYARLTPVDWSAPIITLSNKSQTQSTPLEFTATSDSGLLYGIFATSSDDARFYFAARFDDPVTVTGSVSCFVELSLLLASLVDN